MPVINMIAMFASFVYTGIYYRYAQGRAKRISGWAMVGEILWGAVLLVVYFAAFFGGRNEEVRVVFFGVWCTDHGDHVRGDDS